MKQALTTDPNANDGLLAPLWSVMIPTFNPDIEYLLQAIGSVLSQAPGPEQMQITVVDDCSTKDAFKAAIRDAAGDRISIVTQPQNLGLARNWNSCISHARGEWIHILHQDDMVLPGFYERIHRGISQAKDAGAVITRWVSTDKNSNWTWISPLEGDRPGVLDKDWVKRLATRQSVACASIVVNRRVYSSIGGFREDLIYSLDWEMWVRIACHCPVWFDPAVLATFRHHDASQTPRLANHAADSLDTAKAIGIFSKYLPFPDSKKLTRRAYQNYATIAFIEGFVYLKKGRTSIFTSKIAAGFKMSPTPRTLISFLYLSMEYLMGRIVLLCSGRDRLKTD